MRHCDSWVKTLSTPKPAICFSSCATWLLPHPCLETALTEITNSYLTGWPKWNFDPTCSSFGGGVASWIIVKQIPLKPRPSSRHKTLPATPRSSSQPHVPSRTPSPLVRASRVTPSWFRRDYFLLAFSLSAKCVALDPLAWSTSASYDVSSKSPALYRPHTPAQSLSFSYHLFVGKSGSFDWNDFPQWILLTVCSQCSSVCF